MTDRKPFNRELYGHLLREGTDPAVARRLAEKSEPEDDVQVDETEATPARPPVTGEQLDLWNVRPLHEPGLSPRWAKVVKLTPRRPGRTEVTLPVTKPPRREP